MITFLTPLHTCQTRGNNILNLVIASVPDDVKHISVSDPSQSGIITDHSVISFNYKKVVKATLVCNRIVYDYRRGDFHGLRSALQATNLSGLVESDTDININWLQWKDAFMAGVSDFIPTKKIKGKNSPPWINAEIIHRIKKKEADRKSVV